MDVRKQPNFVRIIIPCLTLSMLSGGLTARADNPRQSADLGRELFIREWLPGDRRSHAGDGLGPLYNARSCVACHQLGGTGGAGPRHMNVTLVNAFLEAPRVGVIASLFGAKPKPVKQPERSRLAEIHPALSTANSFPLHRFATDKGFAKWKRELFGHQFFSGSGLPDAEEAPDVQEMFAFGGILLLGGFQGSRDVGGVTVDLVPSQRNAPPLFGLGAIDRIPNRVLAEVAAEQARDAQKQGAASGNSGSLPVSGRVAQLRDGRSGRFGWKAQTATLRDFTLDACAIELGLEVPGFPQAAPPWIAGYKAKGLDLTAEQCEALIGFVRSLPPPAPRRPETDEHAAEIDAGRKLFGQVGCAVCHRPTLGEVDGIYSDLLLHDMGPALSDSGIYGGATLAGKDNGGPVGPLPIATTEAEPRREKPPKFGAAPREWRTPPLWGLRDSAPYLHDGRADTLGTAIAFHGGEGFDAAQRFLRLSLRERQQVELFLEALPLPKR